MASLNLLSPFSFTLLRRTILFMFLIFGMPSHLLGQGKSKVAELEQSLSKAIQQKDDKNATQYSLELALFYKTTKQNDKAITYFTQSLKYSKQLKDYTSQLAANKGLGQIYSDQKNYSKASDFFDDAAEAAHSANKKLFEAEALISLSLAEESATKYKRTISPMEKALALAVELKNEKLQLDCYIKLAEMQAKLGNTKESKVYQNLYQQIAGSRKDMEANNLKLNQLKQQVKKVESEKEDVESDLHEKEIELKKVEDSLRLVEVINRERQLQIDLLNKDKEIADIRIREQSAEIKNERLIIGSILGGMLLGGILIAVVIFDYRKKLETNKKIHKQSESIKSSINYAKRIQEAMLSKREPFQAYATDSFILFKPKDNVSGDFYWFKEIINDAPEKDFAFAAVDCTGHGVPGAFMSMIGMNALNSITGRGITHPDHILNALHIEIRSALRQQETGNNDGMDVALCVLKKSTNTLEYSGAKNPLVYIQNKELKQVKGDIHPIGGSKSKPEILFKRHEIIIDKPTVIYLFSDGYRDQFGGKENTKFMSKSFSRLLLEIHDLPMEKQKELLDITIEEWKGSHTQTDDILVMGVKFEIS